MTIFQYAIARHVFALRNKIDLTNAEERFLVWIEPTLRAIEARERAKEEKARKEPA